MHITFVSAFMDNYIWLLRGEDGRVTLVDPGDAAPVLAALQRSGLELAAILVTHHHRDHIGGISALSAGRKIPIYGPPDPRIPMISHPLRDGDRVHIPGLSVDFEVMEVPGHTRSHIAYYGDACLFCGDTLFTCGCGALFEGTPHQMQASLDRFSYLPDSTLVYCAHEYTLQNIEFALEVEPDSAVLRQRERETRELRRAGRPTVPASLGLERRTNPFLRWAQPQVIEAARHWSGEPLETPWEVFGAVRRWKDALD